MAVSPRQPAKMIPAGGEASSVTVLLHPSAIAVDADNNYIVADQGAVSFATGLRPAIWRVSSTGQVRYQSSDDGPPLPAPLYSGQKLREPTAVVVDKQSRYSVADIGPITEGAPSNAAIYRFAPSD